MRSCSQAQIAKAAPERTAPRPALVCCGSRPQPRFGHSHFPFFPRRTPRPNPSRTFRFSLHASRLVLTDPPRRPSYRPGLSIVGRLACMQRSRGGRKEGGGVCMHLSRSVIRWPSVASRIRRQGGHWREGGWVSIATTTTTTTRPRPRPRQATTDAAGSKRPDVE